MGIVITEGGLWLVQENTDGKRSNLRLRAVQLVQTGINQSQLACVSKSRQSLCGRQ